MQTMWDSIQQLIRILLYIGTGWLVQRGIVNESIVESLIGVIMGVLTGFWTFYWNRRAVTVPGLEAAGAANAAMDVQKALKTAKK